MTTTTLDSLTDFSQTLDRTKVAIRSNSYAYQYSVATQSLTHVTDVNYPAVTVRGLVYLDGTFYVMDQYGQIWGSAVNDFTTWSALNVINAQAEPDAGVCLTKYNQYVVAFGAYTTQFFFDNANSTGSPLSPVSNGDMTIGCANGDTVQQIGKNLFFVSQDKAQGQATTRGFSVAMMDGMSINPISSADVERILNADGLIGAWGATLSLFGHDFYLITMPATLQTLAYDVGQKFWSFLNKMTAATPVSVTALTCATQVDGTGLVTATAAGHGNVDGDPVLIGGASPTGYNGTFNITYLSSSQFTYPVPAPLTTSSGTIVATGNTASYLPVRAAFQNGVIQVFQDDATGKLYQFSDTLFTDNGAYIDAKARNVLFDNGTNQFKFMPWMDIISDRASANILERHSDDDYQTYSKYRISSLSGARTRFTKNGKFLLRANELRHTDNVAFRLRRVNLGLEQGTE
jgi:hypothetical protein